jgi:hypothetical protein
MNSSEAINIAVLEMSEDGALNSLKRKWWFDRSECHSGTAKVATIFSRTHQTHVIIIDYSRI